MKSHTGFNDLATLPYRQPDTIIDYGETGQFAEFWDPGGSDPHPLVVMLHGGCWMSEYDLTHVRALCANISTIGYAVYSIEYRRIGQSGGGWPGTFSDVTDGLNAALKLNNINFDKVVLTGHSAGGHLALWLMALGAVDQSHPFHGALELAPRACIALAAISDLAVYSQGNSPCERATLSLLGGGPTDQPVRYQYASPFAIGHAPNTYLLHGTDDGIVKPNQSSNFAKKTGATFVPIEGAGHFDLVNPESIAWPVLKNLLLEQAR